VLAPGWLLFPTWLKTTSALMVDPVMQRQIAGHNPAALADSRNRVGESDKWDAYGRDATRRKSSTNAGIGLLRPRHRDGVAWIRRDDVDAKTPEYSGSAAHSHHVGPTIRTAALVASVVPGHGAALGRRWLGSVRMERAARRQQRQRFVAP